MQLKLTLRAGLLAALAVGTLPMGAQAQDRPSNDPVIQAMWDQGMTENSQVEALAQILLDSVGPRLSGSSGFLNAKDWVLSKYAEWGISAEAEQYGTWRGWERGITHN